MQRRFPNPPTFRRPQPNSTAGSNDLHSCMDCDTRLTACEVYTSVIFAPAFESVRLFVALDWNRDIDGWGLIARTPEVFETVSDYIRSIGYRLDNAWQAR